MSVKVTDRKTICQQGGVPVTTSFSRPLAYRARWLRRCCSIVPVNASSMVCAGL